MLRSSSALMYSSDVEVTLWPLCFKNTFFWGGFSGACLPPRCSENIHNSRAAVTQSNKMPFQSLSSFIVIPIRHLHKYIIHGSNPGFRWGDIKCDSVCVCVCVLCVGVCVLMCMQMAGEWSSLFCLWFAHFWFSSALSINEANLHLLRQ